MNNILNLILLITFIALVGCARQTFVINQEKAAYYPDVEQTHHFFMYGQPQLRIILADQICGGRDKVVKVEFQATFFNNLLSVLTLGIYHPRQFRVYCSKE